MKVRLNLATAPLEGNRSFLLGAALVGGIGVLAMLFLSWHAYSLYRSNEAARVEEARLEADMTKVRAERADLDEFFNRPDTVQKRDRAAYLNNLIAERAFPWTRIFTDLERYLPEGVRVVSIEPHLAADHLELRFTVGAMNDDGALKFLRALENSREFSQIEVLGELRSTRPTDIDHVVLSVVARYSAT